MKVLSVNVSMAKPLHYRGKNFETGIFKVPVEGPVAVGALGLEGDQQADLQAHGGPYKAVYAYSSDYYPYWASKLGRDDLAYGQFGENLTVEGLHDPDVRLGDVFRVGTAVLQATQPRLPCFKLGAKMGDTRFIRQFMDSRRLGVYLRVLQEGELTVGDEFKLEERSSTELSIPDLIDLWYVDRDDVERAAVAICSDALPPAWREGFEERLQQARGGEARGSSRG